MKTMTLYYDPQQSILHVLTAEVNELTGNHKVVSSQIGSAASGLACYVARAEQLVGPGNVRAYTIQEVKF